MVNLNPNFWQFSYEKCDEKNGMLVPHSPNECQHIHQHGFFFSGSTVEPQAKLIFERQKWMHLHGCWWGVAAVWAFVP
jgi:hypothetical protein